MNGDCYGGYECCPSGAYYAHETVGRGGEYSSWGYCCTTGNLVLFPDGYYRCVHEGCSTTVQYVDIYEVGELTPVVDCSETELHSGEWAPCPTGYCTANVFQFQANNWTDVP